MKKLLLICAMLWLGTSGFAQVTPCVDANEPNNTTLQNTAVSSLPYTTTGCLLPADQDWFSFSANGTNYLVLCRGFGSNTSGGYNLDIAADTSGNITIATSAPSPNQNTDTYLELYDAGGVVRLAQNDDYNLSNSFYSRIVYNPAGNPGGGGGTGVVLMPQYAQVSDLAGTVTTTISAAGAYTYSTSSAWLSINGGSSGSGSGNGALTINYAANTSAASRSANVVFNSANGGVTVFNIYQSAVNAPPVPCTDPLEPNNTPATAVATSFPYNNALLCLTPGDQDWFSLSFAGNTYNLKCRGFSPNGSMSLGAYTIDFVSNSPTTFTVTTGAVNGNIDTYLELYDSSGVRIAFNDDFGGTFQSQINYNTQQTFLAVTPTFLQVSDSAGTATFSVASNTPWTVSSSAPWLSIAPAFGVGNGSFTVSYNANTFTNNRSASINLSGGGSQQFISLYQMGSNGSGTPCLDPLEPNNAVGAASAIGALPYSNAALCLTAQDQDWFDFSYLGVGYKLKCRGFSPNNTGEYALDITTSGTGFVVTTSAVAGGGVTDTYLELFDSSGVNQLGYNDDFGSTFFSQLAYNLQAVYLMPNPSQLVVASTAGTDSIGITSNLSYTINTMSSWISLSATSGTNNSTLNISYAANPNTWTRTGMVRLMAPGMMRSVYVTQLGTNGSGNPGGGTPPLNDEACSAYTIAADSTCNLTSGTTVDATYNLNTVAATCPTPYNSDVWYLVAVPASGTVTLRTSAGTMFDAVMAVYEGGCNNLTYIDCEDDNFSSGGGLMPVITVTRPAGTILYVRIWGFGSAQGSFDLCAVDYATPTFVAAQPNEMARKEVLRSAVASTLRAFPNPLNRGSNVYLELKNVNLSGNDRLRIYDMMGKIVVNTTINAAKTNDVLELNTSDLAQGIYYLQVETQEGKILGEKIRVE